MGSLLDSSAAEYLRVGIEPDDDTLDPLSPLVKSGTLVEEEGRTLTSSSLAVFNSDSLPSTS